MTPPDDRSRSDPRPGALNWVVIALGGALAVATVVGAAEAWDSRNVVVVAALTVGVILVGVTAHRIQEIVVEVKEGAWRGRVGMAGQALTDEVKHEVRQGGLKSAAGTYAFIHNQLSGGRATEELKVRLQDELVTIAERNAFAEPIGGDEIARVMTEGPPAERVLAFGAMLGNPSLATVPLVVQGIGGSLSGNEQFQALRVAQRLWATLTPQDRAMLEDTIESAPYLRTDPDRRDLAEQILGRPLRPQPV